jgi:hypothetical protein
MNATKWTVNAIKEANRAAGSHWFDPSTMRAFGTRVLPEVYQGPGGVYFVTCDSAGFRPSDGREYNVRRFEPSDGQVRTAEGAEAFDSAHDASADAARRAFGGQTVGVSVTSEEYAPVSVLEQFVLDCRTHGNAAATPADCRKLIKLAGRYHAQAEAECNGTGRTSPITARQIGEVAARVGAAAVSLSGDPRGAVVKLRWADGATNDFGGEGWIVPTSEKDDE